jgi:pyruvate dehydrogenase E2 component (dihydrolipoamide acetyltransferase)
MTIVLTFAGRKTIVKTVMATPVIMPKQGQSVETCVIIGWKKRPGDPVKAGEVLCEVETDKATFEVESPAEGTLLAIFRDAGSDVPVLSTIAAIGKPGENVDALRGEGAPTNGGAAAAVTSPSPAAATSAPPASPLPAAPAAPTGGRIMASPRAKALAASRGVTLVGLRGTGPGGRIVERDVQAATPGTAAAARTPAYAPAPGPLPAGEVREIKVTGIRRLIAERMLASLQTTAQLTMHSVADARSLQLLRKKFKESPEAMGLRSVTINDMILFAVSRTLTQFPDCNALFIGDTIRQYAAVHLGFAVDTPRGLMVPVVKNAQALSLRDIAQESARLIAGCRDGGIRPEEMAGGTFTVTNLGAFGVHGFTPVLNVPQCAILGVGTIVPGPVMAVDGSVSFIPQIGLSLTVNHQVVDGAPGARLLQGLAEAIAGFELLLAR